MSRKIRFAHYSPNPWHQLFTDYLGDAYEPVFQKCDKNCDFIWCGSASMLEKAFPASMQFGKPIIAWVWDIPNIFPSHAGRVQMYINALRQCTKVIAASKFTQKTLATYGVRSDQMYFYADTRDLYASEKGSHIIQISRFTPHKNFEVAQQATHELDLHLVNVGFLNAGEQAYYATLQKSAKSNVAFMPNLAREDMVKQLSTARVLVSSSIFEGWGLTPIEALNCSTPIIVSDIPVFREQYEDSVLYHDPKNPDSLKAQLDRVVNDLDLQKQIVRDGQLRIQDFTPAKFAERWTKYISQL